MSVYPVKDVSCATNLPEVEMREWVEERVVLLPRNIMLSSRRVAVESSAKRVSSKEDEVSWLMVNPVSVSRTPEMSKKGVEEHDVMKKLTWSVPLAFVIRTSAPEMESCVVSVRCAV